jgi:glyoxylase-like metal-dependent hydrolase (beta-lactamase superfamily II)
MVNDWVEVAERCFVRRYPEWDLSVTVVAGEDSALVVDTRATRMLGAELRQDIERLGVPPLAHVVNTHVHFDHSWGNQAFADLPVWAAESVRGDWDAHVASIRSQINDTPDADPTGELLTTDLRPPDRSVASVAALDLGDRYVELVAPGRGHTAGDLVVVVPDAGLLCAGDVVEQSGPLSYGEDCWPLEWPQTLELVIGLMNDDSVVVPGHGCVVDKAFVLNQRLDAADIAGQIDQLVTAGVPADQALASGTWPYDAALLEHAVRRGRTQLLVRTARP